MSYRKLPEGVLDFVRDNATGRSSAELAKMTNAAFGTSFSASSMKGYKASHGIRSGIKPKPPSVFTPEIREYIFSNYEGVPYVDMMDMVNQHFGTSIPKEKFRWFYQNNKLRCGVYWTGNSVESGSVSQKQDDYQYIKTEDGKWRLLHHVVWEKVHGPIPAGYTVTFLDGNIQNASIENLALISRAEQMILTKCNLRFEDPQLTETGILIAKVKVASNKRKKGRRTDEADPGKTEKRLPG